MADTNTPPTLGPNAGKALGKSGTNITAGIITLEEYNRKLVGKLAIKQYDIMRRSGSAIRSVLQVVKLPLLAANWNVMAAQIDPDDKDVKGKIDIANYKARFVKRELMERNVNFMILLKDLLSGLEFGFDVEEKTYELTEFEGQTRIGVAKIDKRKQTTIFNWALQDGKTPGVTQFLPDATGNVYIPMDKLIVFTHDKEGDNYEGISMLRYVYKDWDIADKLTIVNAIAIEKMAIGVPVIKEEPNQTASPTDITEAKELMRNFRGNEEGFLYLPSTLGVAMLDLKANSTKEVIPTLQYHDRRISQSILAQFMEIGGKSGSGSQALAKDLTSLFMKSEFALANLIISTLQEQFVKQICDFNWANMSEGYPTVTVSNLADDDVVAITTAVAALVTAGALTPEATMEDNLREILGQPKLPDDIKKDYQAFRPAKPAATPPADPIAEKDKQTLKDTDRRLLSIKANRRKLIDDVYARR